MTGPSRPGLSPLRVTAPSGRLPRSPVSSSDVVVEIRVGVRSSTTTRLPGVISSLSSAVQPHCGPVVKAEACTLRWGWACHQLCSPAVVTDGRRACGGVEGGDIQGWILDSSGPCVFVAWCAGHHQDDHVGFLSLDGMHDVDVLRPAYLVANAAYRAGNVAVVVESVKGAEEVDNCGESLEDRSNDGKCRPQDVCHRGEVDCQGPGSLNGVMRS
jgi:hypothetical protein